MARREGAPAVTAVSQPPGRRRKKRRSRRRAATPRGASERPPAAPRARKRLPRAVAWTILGLLVLGVGSVAWLAGWAIRAASGPTAPVALDWPGDPTAGSALLAERGVIDDARAFRLLLLATSPFVHPEPGPHVLMKDLSPAEVVRRLGRLPSRTHVKVTFPEGFNQFQVADRLAERGIASREAFLREATDREALLALGVPGDSAEGYLFPATYDLGTDSHPARIVETLVKESKRRLGALAVAHGARMKTLEELFDWSEEELIILASIVEKEARVAEEMPIIASVFFNRLVDPVFRPARMLQSDPTAGYGCLLDPARASCAAFDGRRITPAMLRDADNPYNTYRNEGLPPGPIANPGKRALEAVLAPADTDYLFFVVKEGGRHAFSRTYEEHDAAVQVLRAGRAAADAR